MSRLTSSLDKHAAVVRPGDSLGAIAARHNVTPEALLHANPHIRDLRQMAPGVELTIPSRTEPPKPKDPELTPEAVAYSAGQATAKRLDAWLEGQVRAALLNQLKLGTAAPSGAQPTAPRPLGMVDRMKNSGMTNVSEPPTSQQLRDYYQNFAPARDLLAKGDYQKAAQEYK